MMKRMIIANKTPRAITVIGYCLLVIVLSSCSGDGSQMRAQLEELERQNREYEDFTTDSLAKELVDYFDRHGTANERLRSHYILGCVYRDLGEAPRAVDTYLDAASQADTTANDCDFRTLGCVYAQMGSIYHRQLLLTNEIEARRKSYHYAMMAADTLGCLSEMKYTAGAYILKNQYDSAEFFLKEALRLYDEYGFIQDGLRSSTMLMSLYVNQPNHIDDLKRLIDRYESECDIFDKQNELHSRKRIYYYYKGKYFEGINQLDSAEFYYRKVYHTDMAFVAKNSMYEGLLSVFKKRHQADSIAKYAQLYCMANDSSIALNDRQTTAQMAASYNYNRFQKQAFENEKRADRERHHFHILLIIAFLLASAGIYAFFRYKKRKRREIESLKSEYAEVTRQYNENLHSIDVLENAHKQVVNIIQQELHNAKDKTSKYESAIADINNQYEADILELKAENEKLQDTICQLKQCKDLSPFIENSQLFFASDIVKRIIQNAEKSVYSMSDDEWNEFIATAKKHFPALVSDLNAVEGITPQKIRVCFLTILPLRAQDLASFMGVPSQRISNLKSELNERLFGESTARSLYHNLAKKYNIMV